MLKRSTRAVIRDLLIPLAQHFFFEFRNQWSIPQHLNSNAGPPHKPDKHFDLHFNKASIFTLSDIAQSAKAVQNVSLPKAIFATSRQLEYMRPTILPSCQGGRSLHHHFEPEVPARHSLETDASTSLEQPYNNNEHSKFENSKKVYAGTPIWSFYQAGGSKQTTIVLACGFSSKLKIQPLPSMITVLPGTRNCALNTSANVSLINLLTSWVNQRIVC